MAEHESNRDEQALSQITGTVKWFDPRKGFGFIIGPDGQDIFVHFTVIDGEGFRVLKDGSQVTYDAEHNEKGWRAVKVYREQQESDEGGDDDTPGGAGFDPNSPDPDAPEVVVPRRTYSRTPRR